MLEDTSQALIDDTALGVNLVNQYFTDEIYVLAPGATVEDLLDDLPPRNRAERRRRSQRRRR